MAGGNLFFIGHGWIENETRWSRTDAKLSPGPEVSTDAGREVSRDPLPYFNSFLGRWGVAPGPENVADRRREIIQSCARHNDRVPPAVSFLGYPQEFSTLVLAEFEMKPLPFDLNFLRFENAVH